MTRPRDYSRPFPLEGPIGNNAFSYDRRGPTPRLWVPSLIDGTLDDVKPGDTVAFEDVDEDGVLRSCTGLSHLVRTTWRGVPTVVMDNHNHAFYFWFEAISEGRLAPGATLVHLDQHRDTRAPARGLGAGPTLPEAFTYTNFELNVGNYIVPARETGLIGEIVFATGRDGLAARPQAGRGQTILNIDLDFFAPEMAYIEIGEVRAFIDAHLAAASLVTIATSPFFIDQTRAIDYLRMIWA